MRVDRALEFKDKEIHEAATFALDRLMAVQYPNGAWPQRFTEPPDPAKFPVKRASYPDSWSRTWPGPDYRSHYTFNDNSISDMIDAMLEASRIYNEPKYLASAEKGGAFILLAQMPDPQPGWAQQYDADMHPAWARIFEPPAVTGGESQGILKTLLLLYRETGKKKYLEPIPRALAYYRRSRLPEVENPSAYRQRACPAGNVCMARFYELKTNRPLYITKGTRVGVSGESTKLFGGYELSYSDESVITHYGVLTRGASFDPIRLRGLSPWQADASATPPDQAVLAQQAQAAVASLTPRGAWVEEGSLGRTEQLAQVFAAEEMVATIGDRSYTINEDEYLRVYRGKIFPSETIISSNTFAKNVEALSAYLSANRAGAKL
jgi:PelA/Pel-15E family pectate lyase